MVGLLFPKIIDNTYRGQWLALVLFLPVLALKLMMGFNVAGLNPTLEVRDILQNVDGIPLDSFSPEAVSEILFMANAWGFSLFIICIIGVIALLRYRAMIPVAILLLTIEQVGRKAMSIAESGLRLGPEELTAGNIINWFLSAVLVLALILSVVRRRSAEN
ncbi:MAG: hypothetical protein HKP25_11125 [Marinicaulis sp.]|nr:hypothetical protein [Marinicaulis sp.]